MEWQFFKTLNEHRAMIKVIAKNNPTEIQLLTWLRESIKPSKERPEESAKKRIGSRNFRKGQFVPVCPKNRWATRKECTRTVKKETKTELNWKNDASVLHSWGYESEGVPCWFWHCLNFSSIRYRRVSTVRDCTKRHSKLKSKSKSNIFTVIVCIQWNWVSSFLCKLIVINPHFYCYILLLFDYFLFYIISGHTPFAKSATIVYYIKFPVLGPRLFFNWIIRKTQKTST